MFKGQAGCPSVCCQCGASAWQHADGSAVREPNRGENVVNRGRVVVADGQVVGDMGHKFGTTDHDVRIAQTKLAALYC
jgi:hypothetical protein